jgi:glycosyltransferase involved in cell wall biosynthesis
MNFDASIIVPAFDEENRIGPLLRVLTDDADGMRLKIVVVCNGCHDRTASIARSFPHVIVEELPQASKHLALNIGDNLAGEVFPRFYVDADITIDRIAIAMLSHALKVPFARAVAPSIYFRTSGKPWLVRAFYFTLVRLPSYISWSSDHIAGRGVYGTNREGRTRFGEFPPVRNDDSFFDLAFNAPERMTVDTAIVGVDVPDSARQLVRNRTRVRDGNLEIKKWFAKKQSDGPIHPLAGRSRPIRRFCRYVARWKGSKLFAEQQSATATTYLAGYFIVELLILLNSILHKAIQRPIPWR